MSKLGFFFFVFVCFVPLGCLVPADISVYPESLLPFPRGAAGNALRPGHRHVVLGLHLGRDAHWRTSL